jgi:hypothetical protein
LSSVVRRRNFPMMDVTKMTTRHHRRRTPSEVSALIIAELACERPMLTEAEKVRYAADRAMFDALAAPLRGPPYTIDFDRVFAEREGGGDILAVDMRPGSQSTW